MIRKSSLVALVAFLAVLLAGGPISAFHGFGGGGGFAAAAAVSRRWRWGFRGGYGGGFRGGGGYGGGFRGGYGGMESFGRTPSFSAGRSYGGYGSGMSYGSRGAAEGMRGGQLDYGARSGSYDTARGGTINYGAAGVAARGPGGGVAGRGAYGVEGTTAGGRSYADVGRAGAAVGPGGNAVAGRSNVAAASGPRGTAVEGSRGFAASGSGGAYAGRSYGASALRPNGFNAYGGYHNGWVHGYWGGHDSAAWGWRNPYWGGGWGYGGWGMGLGMGLGLGLGYGLSSWGYGSSLYGMGYMPYSNPYYDDYYGAGAGVAMASPYNYSQPIDTVSAAADESVTNPAEALFDAGRASFKQGNYTDALQQADAALAKLPNDTTLHEFRALCLFALKRVRRGRRGPLRRALGRARLGLDHAHRPLSRHRHLHCATARARGLLPVAHGFGLGPVRACLPLPDPGTHRRRGEHPQASGRPQAWRYALGEAAPAARPVPGRCRCSRPRSGRNNSAARCVDRRDLDRPAGRRHRDRTDHPAWRGLHLAGHQERPDAATLRQVDLRRGTAHSGSGQGAGAWSGGWTGRTPIT